MKTLLIIALVLIPNTAMSWDTQDTYYQSAVISALAVDMAQTLYISKNHNKYYEINPLLGKHPSQDKVIGYFLGGMIAHTAIAMALPPKLRRIWQCVWIGVESLAIYHNYSVGVKLEF